MKHILICLAIALLAMSCVQGCMTSKSPDGTVTRTVDIQSLKALHELVQMGIEATPEILALYERIQAAQLAMDKAENEQEATERKAELVYYKEVFDSAVEGLKAANNK